MQFSVVDVAEDYQHCCPGYEYEMGTAYEQRERNYPIDYRNGD